MEMRSSIHEYMTEDIDFNYDKSFKIDINDGCIRHILVEDGNSDVIDKEGNILLPTACGAIIEFYNGKKMWVTNSEWVSLVFL